MNNIRKIGKVVWSKSIVVCCLLLAACNFVHAQIKFSAAAPKSVGVNQQFQLTYTVENGSAKTLTPPALSDFQVLGGPSTSQNMSWVNGQVSQSVSYTYYLKPKKEGTFTIGKGVVNVQGVNMESNELAITVTAAVQQQQQQRRDPFAQFDPFDPFGDSEQEQQQQQQQRQQPQQSKEENQRSLKENVFVKFVTDKSNVYVGERVTATMRLYFRYGIAQYALPKAPTFEGFWSQEVQMPKEPKRRTETVNGQQYNVVDLQVYNLYPQRAGALKITPADFDMVVQIPVRSFWGMQYQNTELKTSTNGVAISVKELPAAGKPADFSGAVGQFTYSTKLSSKEGKTDNAVTYSMKISGSGNFKMIEVPKPELPDGFEVFDPKIKDDVANSAAGMSGTKQYDYLTIPRQPGDYKIPASSFSYFDPAAARYVTLSSPELALSITGAPSQNLNSTANNTAGKEDVTALHSDIRFIKTSAGQLEKAPVPFFGSAGFMDLLGTPFLLFAGLIFVKRKNEDLAADIVGTKRRRATGLAKKRLSAADKHLVKGDKPAFYDEVSRAILGYLGGKLNIDQSQLSKDNVEEKLLAKNVKPDTITKLKNLISVCEQALYSPVGAGSEMKQNYNAAVTLITDLEGEIK